jgi:hypothetical protein
MFKFYKYQDWIADMLLSLDYDEYSGVPLIFKKNEILDLQSNHLYTHYGPPSFVSPLLYLAINPSEVALSVVDEHISIIETWKTKFNAVIAALCNNKSHGAKNILERYIDKIDNHSWSVLNISSSSEKSLELCKKYNKIDMFFLSCNCLSGALDILSENQSEINFVNLSMNTNDRAINLLEKNVENIDWANLTMNSNDKVYDLLVQNPDKIEWNALPMNKNDKILSLFEKNIDKMNGNCWFWLSLNNSNKALEILEANPDKIVWPNLAENDNDKAIELLRKNLNKIEVHLLFRNHNPKAIELIKEMGIVGCKMPLSIFENPNIFAYNYEAMKDHMKNTWLRDLLKYWCHPKNVCKWSDWGWDDCPNLDNFGL